MVKILITGGSGFIGTNLIEFFKDYNCTILNLDYVRPKIYSHLQYWKEINICNLKSLEKEVLAFRPDFIVHLAARTDLNGKSLKDYDSNILGVQNILSVCDKIKNLKRVIFTSSMYVCEPGYQPADMSDYKPHTIYGESKVITEKLIKEHASKYTWCLIRPTSIWGPYFGEPYNLFFKIVLSGKYFHLGNRACKKTYGFIENFVYQLISLLEAPSETIHGNVYYLGDYEPYDISEWANEIGWKGGITIPTIPFFIFRIAAIFGDILKIIGLKFPMTSFRLQNMTTDNVHDLSLIRQLAPNLPVSRIEGTIRTINWLRND